MDNVELTENVCRQVNDIIVKAAALKTCQYFETGFDEFSSYNKELMNFIEQHSTNPEIIRMLNDIPEINAKMYYRKYWYVFLWAGRRGREYYLKVFSARDIDFIKDEYSLLYRKLTGMGW